MATIHASQLPFDLALVGHSVAIQCTSVHTSIARTGEQVGRPDLLCSQENKRLCGKDSTLESSTFASAGSLRKDQIMHGTVAMLEDLKVLVAVSDLAPVDVAGCQATVGSSKSIFARTKHFLVAAE